MPSSRWIVQVTGVCALAATVCAGAWQPGPRRPADIAELVDRARGLPAEFAADALIRIAGSEKVADRAWKRELLEEAFRRAAGAQQPLRKRAVAPVRGAISGLRDRAFSQELDARSLQSRAVRALLAVNPAKARELLLEMPPVQLNRLTCDDGLVYDVAAFYEAVGEVVERAFTAREVAADEPFKLLQRYVSGVHSPVQVGPVAHLLAAARLKPGQQDELVTAFAAALKDLSGDDRSFTFAISRRGRLNPRIYELVAACKARPGGAEALAEAYRAFLVRHLKAARCADGAEGPPPVAYGMDAPPQLPGETASDPVAFFNDSLRTGAVPAIEPDQVRPDKVEGKAEGGRPCDSRECIEQAKAYTALLFGPGGLPLSPEQKQAPEWRARLKEYLASVASWGMQAEHFVEKCQIYSDLVNVVPNGADRELVLRSFLDFLKQNSFQAESRMEWFLPANSLIARVFLDPLGLKTVMQELRNTSDPVISLYAALEEFAPRPPGHSLGLL